MNDEVKFSITLAPVFSPKYHNNIFTVITTNKLLDLSSHPTYRNHVPFTLHHVHARLYILPPIPNLLPPSHPHSSSALLIRTPHPRSSSSLFILIQSPSSLIRWSSTNIIAFYKLEEETRLTRPNTHLSACPLFYGCSRGFSDPLTA